MSALRRIAVQLLPPFVTNLLRRMLQSSEKSRGRLPGFRDVIKASAREWEAVGEASWIKTDGWLHPSIVETQLSKWQGFVDSIQQPNALGVAHEAKAGAPVNVSAHNIIMTFGYVLGRAIAGRPGQPVRILDWGGGIGHYALLARQLYPEVMLRYTICELQPLVETGRKLNADAKFTSDGEEALKGAYDLFYASSSLQYVHDFYGLLRKIVATGSRWIMICRMPFVTAADDFVVVQRPQRYGYDTEYTGWFLNRDKFVGFMQTHGYHLDREFLNDERPAVAGAPEQCSYRGFLFERSGTWTGDAMLQPSPGEPTGMNR